MDRTQANNFIGILRTALGNGQVPLEHPDWDKLAEWADLQSLTALFYTGASQFQEFAQWDGTKRQKLQREAIAGVVAQSTRTELFLDVYRSLLEKGQKPLVLKGVVVRQLYGELSDYRPSCDEDLYVRPEEAIPCRRELENLGFRITAPEDERKLSDPFQEVSLDHSSGMLHVELHPNFFERSREDLRLSNRYYQNAHDTAVPIHTAAPHCGRWMRPIISCICSCTWPNTLKAPVWGSSRWWTCWLRTGRGGTKSAGDTSSRR